jgi:hypothetical protein
MSQPRKGEVHVVATTGMGQDGIGFRERSIWRSRRVGDSPRESGSDSDKGVKGEGFLMARVKRKELDMILTVTDPPFLQPGADVNSERIQEDILFKYAREIPTRQIGLAITWRLNTMFSKVRHAQGRPYSFTRIEGEI